MGKHLNQWMDQNTPIPLWPWNIWLTRNNNTFNHQRSPISGHQAISQVNV